MAGKLQIQESFQKVYDLEVFKREILNSVFTSEKAKLFREENYIDESNQLTASEKKAIGKVVHYGNLELDDYNTLKLYEITLQPKVRIEQSKVGIQQYVRKMLIAGEGVLVNFINPDNLKTWRLTLVASDTVLTDKGISVKKLNPKRYTFIVGQSEKCKTISDRFADLEKASRIVLYPSENEKGAISLVNIFSVETLSKTFFDEYTLHYNRFVESIEKSNYRKSVFNIDYPVKANKKEIDAANKPIRDFVKKLLGRIVFLYFVQKKGWLGASDLEYNDGDPEFIFNLFKLSGANETFYSNWLSELFFNTLNEQRPNDVFKMPNNSSVKIPYLNGGLFEPEDYDNKLLTLIPSLFHSDDFEDTPLTDKLIKKKDCNHRGFLDFLNAFNFTVHEDSPEDHTVAVDPEMLGHIFENLLEDNKDKGAFYTPKEIVHYMCQKSLIEYLNTYLNPSSNSKDENGVSAYEKQNANLIMHSNQYYEEDYSDIVDFVKNKNINDYILKRAKEVNKYLDTVKICDPAIGSGAFPMGLLQEIFAIKELIAFETGSNWEPAKVKENIIQNSIYGVDIEKGAVDIARLRFWLSLIVNEEKPKALPNLDYKIVVGDSLLSKFGEQVIDIDWDIKGNSDFQKKIKKSIEELVDAKKDFFELKKEKVNAKKDIRTKTIDLLLNILTFDKEKYFKEHSKTKSLFELTSKQQKEQADFDGHIYGFDKAIKELKLLKTNNEKFEFFDWKVDFAELLNENFSDKLGFDIIIGNPPYVSYFSRQAVKVDEQYLNVLKNKSTFIKDKTKKGRYHTVQFFLDRQIKFMKNEAILFNIIDISFFEKAFSDIRGFLLNEIAINEIIANLNVFENVASGQLILSFKNNKPTPNHKVKWKNNFNEEYSYISQNLWSNDSLNTISIPKSGLINSIETGSNNLISYCDVKVGVNIGGVKDYFMKNDNKYYPFINGSNNVKLYKIIFPSEKQQKDGKMYFDFNKVTEKRIWDQGIGTPSIGETNERFLMPKLVIRQSDIRLTATYDNEGYHCDYNLFTVNKLNSSPLELKYILSLLNSKLMTYYVIEKGYLNLKPGKTPQIRVTDVKELPIKETKIQTPFIRLVDFILHLKHLDLFNSNEQLMFTFFEQIIDGMVYELYFPEILQQHNRTIIEHLGDLPAFTDSMSDNQKMEIITTVFNRLNEKNHPVRVNLFYMNSIPEIAIIEGIKEESI